MEKELSDKELLLETIKLAARKRIYIDYDDSMLSNPLVLEALSRERVRRKKKAMIKYHYNKGVSLEEWAESLGLSVHLFSLKEEVIKSSIRNPSTYAALAPPDATHEDLEEIYKVGITGNGDRSWNSTPSTKAQQAALTDLCMKLMQHGKILLDGEILEVPLYLTAEGLV